MHHEPKPDHSLSSPGTPTATAVSDPSRKCRTITLGDYPEQTDAFGPHQRIAEAIAGLIKPPARGISIGIEGNWGSGKSTIARVLMKNLETEEKIATVCFDAWAHQGDPLRRTFLETIIRALQSKQPQSWVNTDYWNERIEVLANRREVITSDDTLSITWPGRVLALTLLFVPIGGAFITAALRDDITLFGGSINWRFLTFFSLGLLLTFSPLLVLLFSLYLPVKKSEENRELTVEQPNTNSTDKKSKDKKSPNDLLSLFLNKGPTSRTTITSRTAIPTSIEFETNFEELLEAALGNNERRLVLILDNLDRVDPTDALTIWSTLQTFLQHRGMWPKSWYERLWVLVLYDLQGLSQLWEKSDNQTDSKTALSFIDKSFQVRFEVPSLVRSDWRDFLITQLKVAFPDHTEDEIHEVYRVFSTWEARRNKNLTAEKTDIRTEKTKDLTLRELKLFVNQIGSVHRQWAGLDHEADTFRLALIAYYVLLRRRGDDVVQLLFNPDFPTKDYQELLGNRVREGLAALAFNVEIEVAQQLLFSETIKNALTLSSEGELKRVASLLRRGFWDVFDDSARAWVSTETLKIADAASAIDNSGVLSTAFDTAAVRSLTRSFCERAANVQAWSPIDHKRATGISTLLKWKAALQGVVEQRTGNEYEQFIGALFKAIALGLTKVDLKLTAKPWLDSINLIVNNLESTTKEKALATIVETLANELRAEADSSSRAEGDPSSPNEEDLSSDQLELVLNVLCELQALPETADTTAKELTGLVDTGTIAAQWHRLKNKEQRSNNATAWMAYVTIRYSSSLNDSALVTEKELTKIDDRLVVGPFVQILQRFNQTSRLFEIPKLVPDLKWVAITSLRIVLNSPDVNGLFNSVDGLERLEFVFKDLRPTPEEESVLTTLISPRSAQFVQEITARDFQSSNAALYLFLLKIPGEEQQEFASWCLTGLRSLESYPDDDLWRTSPVVSLALYIVSLGLQVDLGEKYFHALKAAVEMYMSHQDIPNPTRKGDENLAALIGPLESPSRNAFQQYLFDCISKSETPFWFLPLFSLELKTQLLDYSRGLKIVELLKIILTRHSPSELEWVKDTLAEAGQSLESKYSTEPAWTDFKQAVRQALITGQFDDESYTLVKHIASILNVRLPSNGVIAFEKSDKRKIWKVDPKNLETEILIGEPSLGYTLMSDPSWSPDGKKLAYVGSGNSSDISDILIFNTLSGVSTFITGAVKETRPSWSPDGKMLAFLREHGPDSDIYTINLETREERRLTKESGANEWPNWSPDGTRLVFHQSSGTAVRILVMNADGSNTKPITTGPNDFDPSWSPDGNQIAFARWQKESEHRGIYLINPDGEALARLVHKFDARTPAWSPDGTKLVFQVGHGPDARMFQIDADGKNEKELTYGIRPSWQPLLDHEPTETTETPSQVSETVDSSS